jgi:surface protein
MFSQCTSMTSAPDTSSWNTAAVTNMFGMFYYCSSMTTAPNTSSWNTGLVTNMADMFLACTSMTTAPDTSSWDTSAVTDMSYMFEQCSSMTGLDVSGFDITGLNSTGDLNYFLNTGSMSTANYDATLIAWAAQTVFSGMSPHFGSSTYTSGGAAEAARTSLINDDGWTITDGGAA